MNIWYDELRNAEVYLFMLIFHVINEFKGKNRQGKANRMAKN